MLTQHITGQGQIGFEFAEASSIDQGRQRVSGKIKIKMKMKIKFGEFRNMDFGFAIV
jgi:hypothetical protein